MAEVLKKHEIEAALHAEHQEISAGRLKEDNPFDSSELFWHFCQACRKGDLRVCQEKIQEGVNINARDKFDYTPLILLLLESGALCERDTFQGERALYNALNDRIRNLLLSYDYSKSRDPLQPLAAHITSLLYRDAPNTSDITITAEGREFHLHKFILSARSPYFAKKLAAAPGTTTWKVPTAIPPRALETAILALYFTEVQLDFSGSENDQALFSGIEKLAKDLEIEGLIDTLLEPNRRVARQRRTEEVERGRDQFNDWFERAVVGHQIHVDREKADDVKWDRENSIFADVLLCADLDPENEDEEVNARKPASKDPKVRNVNGPLNGIPIGPAGAEASRDASQTREKRKTVLFPAHRAMLLRSEYFSAMFSSPFREAQPSEHLPIVRVDCNAAVLQVVLKYLYTEHANFDLDVAVDVLFTADQLFIEKLKIKAAMIISTLGNGDASIVDADNPRGETDVEDVIDIYDVVRAGWDTRVHRLEEFGARFIAYRLERYIDEQAFKDLVTESANRIQGRQETDTVELIDDIRYHLSQRFRLRFEDSGFDQLVQEQEEAAQRQLDAAKADSAHLSGNTIDVVNVIDSTESEDFQTADTSATSGGGFAIRTLDGEVAGDEFAQDALNYQILLGKIDTLLEELQLDA
ncbi:hypothetical protein FH972_021538 [Carpinus fangiana]|uniref:BTB domain-containing protein n=1 Tax=Carpinus fangiana TaxID=176857 RepID=A0A5N6KPZ5_9ROSI|nr:hypothetical protein FH972_021538 [Carpinus fangiana]